MSNGGKTGVLGAYPAFPDGFMDEAVSSASLALPSKKTPDDPFYNNFQIERIHAFVVKDPKDNSEGVAAYFDGTRAMPMIASDAERLRALRAIAPMWVKRYGLSMRVVEFSLRKDLEIYEP